MKLIIDIPEELKQKIDEGFTNQVIINKLWDATKNGIPLEQIRNEIKELDRYYDNDYFSVNNCPMFKCNEVLQIIDHYMKG